MHIVNIIFTVKNVGSIPVMMCDDDEDVLQLFTFMYQFRTSDIVLILRTSSVRSQGLINILLANKRANKRALVN